MTSLTSSLQILDKQTIVDMFWLKWTSHLTPQASPSIYMRGWTVGVDSSHFPSPLLPGSRPPCSLPHICKITVRNQFSQNKTTIHYISLNLFFIVKRPWKMINDSSKHYNHVNSQNKNLFLW